MTTLWTQTDAIALCREIERIAPKYGCHVALTGGCLYGVGERKDCDVLFYRIRDVPMIDIMGLCKALETIGLVADQEANSRYGDDLWVIKAWYKGKAVDMFFPEIDDGKPDAVAAGALVALSVLRPFQRMPDLP